MSSLRSKAPVPIFQQNAQGQGQRARSRSCALRQSALAVTEPRECGAAGHSDAALEVLLVGTNDGVPIQVAWLFPSSGALSATVEPLPSSQ